MVKALCFAGSLRKASFNKLYAQVANGILVDNENIDATYVDLLDYPMPVFSQDIEDVEVPQSVKELAKLVKGADAIVISAPEYNASISSPLKNTIDWLSRKPHNPWPGKHVLLIGASPGYFGSVRGLWHTRVPLEELGCFVFPSMSGLPKAHEAFDEAGKLKDPASHERLAKVIHHFVEHIRRA